MMEETAGSFNNNVTNDNYLNNDNKKSADELMKNLNRQNTNSKDGTSVGK